MKNNETKRLSYLLTLNEGSNKSAYKESRQINNMTS